MKNIISGITRLFGLGGALPAANPPPLPRDAEQDAAPDGQAAMKTLPPSESVNSDPVSEGAQPQDKAVARAEQPFDFKMCHDDARAFEHAADWESAERLWVLFIDRASTPIWWSYASLATAQRQQGKADAAIVTLRKGIDSLPGDPHMAAEFTKAITDGADLLPAMSAWDSMIERFPDRWIGYRGKLQSLITHGDSAKANYLILEHAPDFPADIDALADLGNVALQNRDFVTSERIFRKVISLQPHHAWAYQLLAVGLRGQGRPADALMALKDGLLSFPNDESLIQEAALSAEAAGRPDDADDYLKTLEMLRAHMTHTTAQL